MLVRWCRQSARRLIPAISRRSGVARRLAESRKRPLIAFFSYHDVFEDFYPHYGLNQDSFATRWTGSGNHAFLALLQAEVGDVVWYMQSLSPQLREVRHEIIAIRTKFVRSPRLHRLIWQAFYLTPGAWRWHRFYPIFALLASLASMEIGSPLGMPHVKYKISQENDLVRTPSIAGRWTNYADQRDVVAIEAKLGDDYEPNDQGVKVPDVPVINAIAVPWTEIRLISPTTTSLTDIYGRQSCRILCALSARF